MAADRMNQEIPGFAFAKDRGPLVQQKPTDELEVGQVLRRVERQGKVAAALGRTVVAEHLILGNIFAAWLNWGECGGHASFPSLKSDWLLVNITGAVFLSQWRHTSTEDRLNTFEQEETEITEIGILCFLLFKIAS
jgi:hypothetical protein